MRVAVNGCSGSGKTTLAMRVSERLDLPFTELDALQHGAGWVPRPEFAADVHELLAAHGWVVEYGYDVRPAILARADLMVWLDLPRWLCMWQVVARTVRRRVRREELWNGNREGPLWQVLTDPEHVVRWAWTTYPDAARRIDAVRVTRPDLPVVRLRSRREVERWLVGLSKP
ncbi:MAG: AAA family ATPase [Marmoricola sp.]